MNDGDRDKDLSPVILMAGGRGEGMRKYSNGSGKLLVPVHGVPLISRLLSRLRASGVPEVIVITGFGHSEVQREIHHHTLGWERPRVRIVEDKACLGTQRALQLAGPELGLRPHVVLDAATLLSAEYLTRFASREVPVLSVGLCQDLSVAWHHSMAAVSTSEEIRSWWLETELPDSLEAGERFGRNVGILKVDADWLALPGASTAHACRCYALSGQSPALRAVWDDGGYCHFGTPREYGLVEDDYLLHR